MGLRLGIDLDGVVADLDRGGHDVVILTAKQDTDEAGTHAGAYV